MKTISRAPQLERIFASMRYIVLIAVGIMMVYPMLWMLGSSFKGSNAEILTSIGIFPRQWTATGYTAGWKATSYTFGKYMWNTYSYVIPKVMGTVVSCMLAAYAFTRFHYRGRKLFFSVCISTLFLPDVVLMVPQFLMYTRLGWVDTYLPLMLPSWFAVDTYFVFILVQFIRTLPVDMEEAAYLDGCNSLQRLYHVVVPMVFPAIVSVMLFQFMWTSNEFQGPLIYINSVRKYPASLGLRLMMDAESGFAWNRVLAMSVISLLPSLIIFFSAQKQFVEGIRAGGLKG